MKSFVRLFILPVAFAVALFFISLIDSGVSASSLPKNLQWGDKCKTGPNLRPNEECDLAKGLLCQSYTQGHHCGCQIGSSWSYDRESKECRRKVASECYYDSESDNVNDLAFSHKCHQFADCVKPNWTAITGKPSEKRVCQCLSGYNPSKDFSECEPIKTTGSASFVTRTTFFSTVTIPMIILALFFLS